MVGEDVRHRQENRSFQKMTEAEKIEELIYQLREQNARQLTIPGKVSAMSFRQRGSAAWKLVAMGHAAVPRLIDAIDDRRPTRTVGYWRDFTFSHYVLRVGDSAVSILEEIAGRTFWHGGSCVSKEGRENEVRAEVLNWWDRVEAKPESRRTDSPK
jgi:hypothetical protein